MARFKEITITPGEGLGGETAGGISVLTYCMYSVLERIYPWLMGDESMSAIRDIWVDDTPEQTTDIASATTPKAFFSSYRSVAEYAK